MPTLWRQSLQKSSPIELGLLECVMEYEIYISEMMSAMPSDLMYVFRVVEMLRGLLHLLGGTENDRLSIMTSMAVQ